MPEALSSAEAQNVSQESDGGPPSQQVVAELVAVMPLAAVAAGVTLGAPALALCQALKGGSQNQQQGLRTCNPPDVPKLFLDSFQADTPDI